MGRMDALTRTISGRRTGMIQIDMDMPKDCAQCLFSNDESRYCRVANEYIPMFSKPDFCPLIEVKDGEQE